VAEMPTIVFVLSAAKLATEEVTDDDARIQLRARVADAMRRTGCEAAFGAFAAEAAQAEKELIDRKYVDPKKKARYERIQQLVSEARDHLLADEWELAIAVLRRAENLRRPRDKWGDIETSARGLLLDCHLRKGDIEAAKDLIVASGWKTAFNGVGVHCRLARALEEAGRHDDAVAILRAARSLSGLAEERFAAENLAKQFRSIGEVEEAKAVLREASERAFENAVQKPEAPLRLDLARVQMDIGDRDGAVATLRRILSLAVPIEYDPAPAPPPDLAPNMLWAASPTLKPLSKRWLESRNEELAEVLARAGLDAEAFALLWERLVDEPAILVGIVRGQAHRGDFEDAFVTLDRLGKGPLSRADEPHPVSIRPDGRLFVWPRESASVAVDERRRTSTVERGLRCIASDAARLGNQAVFERARAMASQISPGDWTDDSLTRIGLLRELAQGGCGTLALEIALGATHVDNRILGLNSVAEGLAASSKPRVP
jgi:tetratricopeptide (TPR) repeat protein